MLRRGLLLDRDGVINVDRGYVGTPEQFEFMPGLFPFLRAVRDKGYRLAVLTNQSGVARGYYTVSDYERVTEKMCKDLAKEGIVLDLVLAAFVHEEGTLPDLRRESFWRKPNPGMVLEALQRLTLDPLRSAFIGDKEIDMQAAERGGVKTRLWFTEKSEKASQDVHIVKSYDEALKWLP